MLLQDSACHQYTALPADAALAGVWQLHTLLNCSVQNVCVLQQGSPSIQRALLKGSLCDGTKYTESFNRRHRRSLAVPRTLRHTIFASCPPAPRKETSDSPSICNSPGCLGRLITSRANLSPACTTTLLLRPGRRIVSGLEVTAFKTNEELKGILMNSRYVLSDSLFARQAAGQEQKLNPTTGRGDPSRHAKRNRYVLFGFSMKRYCL